MYIGTLDKKLLVIDENKEEVVDTIALDGIPRATALSADRKKLHIFTTQMLLETVDLESRKIISSFNLADPNSRPRMQATAPDRVLVERQHPIVRSRRRSHRPLHLQHDENRDQGHR